jgi:hypothetical protein
MLQGFLRADGRKGIRNILVVAYLVECAHHVAREIAAPFRERGVHLIGFPGCYPNAYALAMMEKLCTHPNVGGALLVSLGCESFDKRRLERTIETSGRTVLTTGIQDAGGNKRTIASGRRASRSCPAKWIVPDSTGTRPDTARSAVVLPAPLAPSRATTSRSSTCRQIPSSARTGPYVTRSSRISSSARLTGVSS